MKLRRWLASRCRRSRPVSQLFLRKLTHREIKKATDTFSMIIGSDSYGTVYRARFSDGYIAAIKKAKHSHQSKDAFPGEVLLLSRLHHRHIIKLVGFSEENERFLAFEYMENGSLRDWLRDPLKTPLNWRVRLKIAIDVAAALEYIYYFCDPPVYDAKVNSSNVMLDQNFVAKISYVEVLDCNCFHNSELVATHSKGELEQRQRNAVFQFGVLVLELVMGQSMHNEEEPLQWIRGSGSACSMHKMVDADLGGNYDSRELRSLLIVARLCTKVGEGSILSIPQILRYLQGKIELSAAQLW
ncbi:hypothetical protein HPP92_001885 [Vanilla planifolia]|uniref:Protein kinase domain-containing protein n=1 Tax=Vanilla planifolia TaxID=51239 RepID=A0A835RSF8_VANPL|nr:hypothetical protein HPP92_001885 [Vanilla planifolia]